MNTRAITRSRESHSIVASDNIEKLYKLIESLDGLSQDGEHELCVETIKAIETISAETKKKFQKLSQIDTLLNIIN